MPTFTYQSVIQASSQRVFAWHERPEALRQLLPPGGLVRVDGQGGGIADGGWVALGIGIGPLRVRWLARHFGYVPGEQFCDEQVRGPFRRWRHVHAVQPLEPDRALLVDRVEYELPAPRWLQRVTDPLVRAALGRMFAARHRVTSQAIIGTSCQS